MCRNDSGSAAAPQSALQAGGGRFRRIHRLAGKRRFDVVFREGVVMRCAEMTLRATPNGLEYSRLGMLVGRRHGNAVKRNRMKRLLRAAFRLHRRRLSTPCDIVIVPRAGWRKLALGAIEPAFGKALQGVDKAFSTR